MEEVGGHYICKYCSSEYSVKRDYSLPDHQYVINIIKPGVQVLGARFFLSEEHKKIMGEEDSKKYMKRHIVDSIAEYIYENFDNLVDLREDFGCDEWRQGTMFDARLRMLNKFEDNYENY